MWPLSTATKSDDSKINSMSPSEHHCASQLDLSNSDAISDSDTDGYISVSTSGSDIAICNARLTTNLNVSIESIPDDILQDEFAARPRGSSPDLSYSVRLPGARRRNCKDAGPADRLKVLRMYEVIIQMTDEELDRECVARGLVAFRGASVAEQSRKEVQRDIAALQRVRARRDVADEDLKIMSERLWAWKYSGSELPMEKLVKVIETYGI